ncbi:hypothetical protein G6F31_013274 [Rhizopus arrhizus]|nr:hypothetical protein G6F31_013274 [Rhizopus arrhizus]
MAHGRSVVMHAAGRSRDWRIAACPCPSPSGAWQSVLAAAEGGVVLAVAGEGGDAGQGGGVGAEELALGGAVDAAIDVGRTGERCVGTVDVGNDGQVQAIAGQCTIQGAGTEVGVEGAAQQVAAVELVQASHGVGRHAGGQRGAGAVTNEVDLAVVEATGGAILGPFTEPDIATADLDEVEVAHAGVAARCAGDRHGQGTYRHAIDGGGCRVGAQALEVHRLGLGHGADTDTGLASAVRAAIDLRFAHRHVQLGIGLGTGGTDDIGSMRGTDQSQRGGNGENRTGDHFHRIAP